MILGQALATAVLSGGHWTPKQLFAAGQKGMWYDPSDLSTMFQNSNGTTPVAVGDPVGYIADKSGNGNHAIQATAGQRPILRQSGGFYYLEFDTVNDWLGTSGNPNFTAASDIVFANQRIAATSAAPFTQTFADGAKFFGVAVSGSGTVASAASGPPSYTIDGTAVPGGNGATRAQLYTAWPQATDNVWEANGANLSAWTTFGFGNYTALAGVSRVYGVVARSTLTAAEMAKVRTYLGAKAGIIR